MKHNTDLKSSLKVLMTLYVMIQQEFEALIYYSDNISEDNLNRNVIPLAPKNEVLDTTIIDSLRFSIVLKACSFLEEWDQFLGVRNEPEIIERLKLIKRTVTKARRALNYWKDLKSFRNEIIAHNFRGKGNEVKIDMLVEYDCPQTVPELYFLTAFMNRMINVLAGYFKEQAIEIVSDFENIKFKGKTIEDEEIEKLKNILNEIDESISIEVFSIARYDIIQGIASTISNNVGR